MWMARAKAKQAINFEFLARYWFVTVRAFLVGLQTAVKERLRLLCSNEVYPFMSSASLQRTAQLYFAFSISAAKFVVICCTDSDTIIVNDFVFLVCTRVNRVA